jgi:regulator of protease activity HflC (stomatin/prohibitin superfamily)
MRTVCDTKTKDNVFVRIDIAVQVQVLPENTYDAVYRLSNPKDQVDSYVKDVIRGQVPSMSLEETFTAKDELAAAVQNRLSEAMASFGYCILNSLVTDIDPDSSVKRAMNEIETSKRQRLAQETKALADKSVQIRAAEADAEAKFLMGQGIARQRGAIVDGLKDSLGQPSAEKVGELLLITQYFDTVKDVANGSAYTIFTPGSSSSGGGMCMPFTPGQQRM